MTTVQAKSIWLNGKMLPASEANLNFLTPALHYGIAAFEGIRCYSTPSGPAIFRLRDHLERLLGSVKILGFRQLPYDLEEITEAVKDVVAENGVEECYIRPAIYLAEGGWNLSVDSGRPHFGIAVWPWNAYLGPDALDQGIRANVSSFTRHHPNVMMTKAKVAGAYVNSVLAKTESMRLGFEEAILLDTEGLVAECTGENIFIARKGKLYTPPGAHILEGITRDTLMTLADDLGIPVHVEAISRDRLYTADEVLVCGTAAEVVGLREIDFTTIGSGRTGPITRLLQHEYQAAVHGEHPRSARWCTAVEGGRVAMRAVGA
jgi:branched-chain amino acid aminotransferase